MAKSLAVVLALLSTVVVLAQSGNAGEVAAIELPPELDRVLRDYEKAWQARDAAALAQLFTEDGFVLSNGKPPVRGRAAIENAYAKSGGPLSLRAFAYSIDGATGYIIGGYGASPAAPPDGKFVLALRKGTGGKWLIAADMDNSNARPRPAPAPAPAQ
jgi:ketosteroid isomerase-like protein